MPVNAQCDSKKLTIRVVSTLGGQSYVETTNYLCFGVFYFFLTILSLRSALKVAVLLRIGGSGEHLYLLCHLLCCPAGVGKWAAHFLQVRFVKPRL